MNDKLAKQGDGFMCPIAVLIKDDKVLTGHRHYTPDKWKKVSVWTLPGGRSELDETIEQTLRREVAEEIGVTLKFWTLSAKRLEQKKEILSKCSIVQPSKTLVLWNRKNFLNGVGSQ